MISLKRRLLYTLTAALVLSWSIIGWISYDKAKHEAEELLDGQLVLSARLIDAQTQHESSYHKAAFVEDGDLDQTDRSRNKILVELLDDTDRHPYEQELAFLVIRKSDNELVLHSENAIEMPMILDKNSYTNHAFDGRLWRIFSVESQQSDYLIQVAHPLEGRDRAGLEVAQQVAIPIILSLPVILLLVSYSILAGFKPLQQLVKEVQSRTANNLNPLPEETVVTEVKPLVQEINGLLNRVSTSLEYERRFTDDAAHELRTPLAGLKIQAQVAAATQDPAVRKKSIERIVEGAKRGQRLVDQMLRLARLNPDHTSLNHSEYNLSILLQEVADAEQVNLRKAKQTLCLELPDENRVMQGDADLLAVALQNLLGNASRYSPDGSSITLGVTEKEHQWLEIFVADNGDGVPEEELPKLKQRFHRGSETRKEGTGLGLAIVDRIAQLHGAELSIQNLPEGGLKAALRFTLSSGLAL